MLTMGRRQRPQEDELEARAAHAQRREIERLSRLNQIEQERFAAMTQAKLERQEAAARRLKAQRAQIVGQAQLRGKQKRDRVSEVRARAQSVRKKKHDEAMKLADSVRSEQRMRPLLQVTPHLRTQRFRRAKGPVASALKRPAARPLTATKLTAGLDSRETPERPRTAPEIVRSYGKRAEPPPSPGFRNFRPRAAPPMPALTPEELQDLRLLVKQECGVCLRQYSLSNLPGVASRRAVTRLRESWYEELGTSEQVDTDVRTSKPSQCYSEVRVCVFCFQFVTTGLSQGHEKHQVVANTVATDHHKVPTNSAVTVSTTATNLLTTSPQTVRINGSPIPTRFGRYGPCLSNPRSILVASPILNPQAEATAIAVKKAKEQAEIMAAARLKVKAGKLAKKHEQRMTEQAQEIQAKQSVQSPRTTSSAADASQVRFYPVLQLLPPLLLRHLYMLSCC